MMGKVEIELVISHLETLRQEVAHIQNSVENISQELAKHAGRIEGLEKEIAFLRQDLRNRKFIAAIKWAGLLLLSASGGYTLKDILRFLFSSLLQ
jgi:predicted  nucleic acid-binding Zn-ribbon protein